VAIIKTPLDPIAITQGSEWYHNFLPQDVGIIAESDLGIKGLRWMDYSQFAWVLWPD
jgi:sphingosine kinase